MKRNFDSSQVAWLLMMKVKRTWRVQPIKNGMKAPYFFVTTEKKKLWQAEARAMKLAEQNCRLTKLGWDIILTLVD